MAISLVIFAIYKKKFPTPGKKAAKEIMQKKITLEEYLQEKQVEVE